MESVIQFLDEQTINQIAAGEVIENSASVVKELVENSLDAGATHIFVTIEAGGQTCILVQDNGIGMTEEDAKRSIGRHATSKIRTHDDLMRLSTLGFRGEALSSIASISEFSIRTAKEQKEAVVMEGTHLQVTGGKILSCERLNAVAGTSIEVRSLFYNVPARKKFQKAPAKDTYEVTKLMTQLALAHPECAFEYVANFKKEFSLNACTLDRRVTELLGQDFTSSLRPVFIEREGITLQGFIGIPAASRPTRTGQYLFINKRPISSLAFSYAIKEGYGTAIDPERHPTFVLHLTIASDSVDVNVHPQKKEVRFRREEELKKLAMEAVEQALFQTSSAAKMTKMQAPLQDFSPNEFTAFVSAKEKEPFLADTTPFFTPPPTVEIEKKEQVFCEPLLLQSTHAVHVIGTFYEYAFLDIQWGETIVIPDKLKNHSQSMVVADCKAALSRIAFEDLTEKKAQENEPSSQRLLVPYFLELSQVQASYLIKMLPYVKKLGLEIREFGKCAFLVEALPVTLEVTQLEEFIQDIVCDAEGEGKEGIILDPVKAIRHFAKIAARVSARKKYPVTSELTKEMIKRLLQCKEPFYCPFGKAIFTLITKEELQKRFT